MVIFLKKKKEGGKWKRSYVFLMYYDISCILYNDGDCM